MEIISTSSSLKKIPDSLDELFLDASNFVASTYSDQLEYYRSLSKDELDSGRFWTEYVWVVYASGFNAKVLSRKFESLIAAVGPWEQDIDSAEVLRVINNKSKCHAVAKCKMLLRTLGWSSFKREYCDSVDTLGELPFIGPVTKYHLARNIGFAAVKPDLHLNRITAYYGFDSPKLLCEFLSIAYDERIGVVDFILWCYLAVHGSMVYVEELGYDPRW